MPPGHPPAIPNSSLTLNGWGSASGESSVVLTAVLQTYDPTAGTGSSNRGHYSNAAFDTLIEKAKFTIDDAGRRKLLEDAMDIGMKDAGVIPLHFQVNIWATRAKVHYEARTDENTLAMSASPAK